jgi:hypothetical protein
MANKIDNIEIVVADNGFVLEFNKYKHDDFDWDRVKLVQMSLEEVFRTLQQELSNNG